MADQTAALRQHATLTSTTADSISLTTAVRQVDVTNADSADPLTVKIATGGTAAAALAALGAAVTALADDTIVVRAGQTKIVHRSRNRTFVALSVVGDGNAYSVEGHETTL